jgi:hypothetical protein
MSTFLNYIKEISLFSESEPVDHSNEFSIKSEDNNTNTNTNSKVKFKEPSENKDDVNKNDENNKTIYNYFDSLKINFTNLYGTANILTTFLTILFMTIKILYKNLTNK